MHLLSSYVAIREGGLTHKVNEKKKKLKLYYICIANIQIVMRVTRVSSIAFCDVMHGQTFSSGLRGWSRDPDFARRAMGQSGSSAGRHSGEHR